ncbi:hypothetical protein ACTZWW_15740 [Salinarimonas sp. NSM]|uniref:hypothetical protein n=1 Tax=Salinarimonas sp. NSM TaxID=3458003 RepID=UPI004036F416
MPLSVVTMVSDPRPVQTGLQTEALAFGSMMETAMIAQIEELMGVSFALLGMGAGTEIAVEPASDRVKISVEPGGTSAQAGGHRPRWRD